MHLNLSVIQTYMIEIYHFKRSVVTPFPTLAVLCFYIISVFLITMGLHVLQNVTQFFFFHKNWSNTSVLSCIIEKKAQKCVVHGVPGLRATALPEQQCFPYRKYGTMALDTGLRGCMKSAEWGTVLCLAACQATSAITGKEREMEG